MTRGRAAFGQLATGSGGVALLVSLFLPWTEAGGARRDGFQLLSGAGVFLVIVGLVAIAAALTWGRYGLFRPDMSMSAAADLLGLTATIVLVWTVFFDFPSAAGPEVGAFLSLVAALAITCGAGDYSTLRGAPWFPRIATGASSASSIALRKRAGTDKNGTWSEPSSTTKGASSRSDR